MVQNVRHLRRFVWSFTTNHETTWDFQIGGFDDKASQQQKSFTRYLLFKTTVNIPVLKYFAIL